jgi:pilus assembly protein CpaC
MIARQHIRACVTALAVAAMLAVTPSEPARSAASLSGSTGAPVVVELNEGRLVRLSSSATSVFVANPAIADVAVKSPRLVYVFGKRAGETTLYAVDRNDKVIASLNVRVDHNLSRLNESLRKLVPNSQVIADSLDGTIVLSGSVADAVDAENARRLAARFIGSGEQLINQISVISANQVNLRVHIAEVATSVVKQFGFNWENITSGRNNFLVTTTGGTDIATDVDPITGATVFLKNSAVDSLFGVTTLGTFNLIGLLEALATDNLVTILAEPNLTALSGETASFLAGGEFPIPIVEDDSTIITFKTFGVSLSFTPIVLSGNRISMRIRPEVSELTTQGGVTIGGFVIPGLTTRRAETTVELGSGQSFAIAGLFANTSREDLRKYPVLGEIPILGQFLSSDRFERRESELMIVVTPYLVKPVDQRIALPTDAFVGGEARRTEANSNLARVPYAPQTIPLNDGSPLAQSGAGRAGFIVE